MSSKFVVVLKKDAEIMLKTKRPALLMKNAVTCKELIKKNKRKKREK